LSDAWPVWLPGLLGGLVGLAGGFAVRRARLCTFGALEDAMVGNDRRRLKIFGLALGLALIGTQLLVAAGQISPDASPYLPRAIPWLSIIIGGLMFGLGMAFVGTCSFGSLVRLGGGDLRSLVVILVFGALAYATLRGVLAPLRLSVLESVTFVMPMGARADLPGLLRPWLGASGALLLAALLGTGLIGLAVLDPRLRRSPRLLLAGTVIGLGVVAGWCITSLTLDSFEITQRLQSLTFVSPVGKLIYGALIGQGNLGEFGVCSVIGVVIGAYAASRFDDEFRWEAFDDDREMRRHLIGAGLMGTGGILCGGCTIGQGLSAGSMLALSWPLAVGSMVIGARLGIEILMGQSLLESAGRLWAQLRGHEP
jgi:uncharacterized protein